jgi:hypothetical protein
MLKIQFSQINEKLSVVLSMESQKYREDPGLTLAVHKTTARHSTEQNRGQKIEAWPWSRLDYLNIKRGGEGVWFVMEPSVVARAAQLRPTVSNQAL